MFSKKIIKSLLVMIVILAWSGCGNVAEDGNTSEETGNISGKGDTVNQAENLLQLAKKSIQLDLTFKDDGNAIITLTNKSKIEVDYRASEPFYLEKFNEETQQWDIAVSMEGGSSAFTLPGALRLDKGLQVTKSGLYRATMIIGLQCDEFLSIGDCYAADVANSNEVYFVTPAEKTENNIQVVKNKIQLDLVITTKGQAIVNITNNNNIRVDYRKSEPIYLEKFNEKTQQWDIAVSVDGGSSAYSLPASLKVEGLNVTKSGLYRATMIIGLQCDEFLSIGDCADSDVVNSNEMYFSTK